MPCCGAEFFLRCGAVVFLNRALYGLKTAAHLFHIYLGGFIIYLVFTTYRADQDLWIHRSDYYEGYDYIETHVDDIIIADKNPSKYMHAIEMHFKVRDIT